MTRLNWNRSLPSNREIFSIKRKSPVLKVINHNTPLWFGKHIGLTPNEILTIDGGASYLKWLNTKSDFAIHKDLRAMLFKL